MTRLLPAGFDSLEPYVARFALTGTAARAQLRSDSSAEERQSFYDAARDLIGPALDMLDTKPLDGLDKAEQNLMNLALAFAHIALAIEIQGPDEVRHAGLRAHMKIVRSTADRAL